MSDIKPIAFCKKGHKLAELSVVDGVTVVSIAGAVAGLSARNGKPRGQFNIARGWWTVALKAEEAEAMHSLYCESCGAEYYATPAQLAADFLKTRRPAVLAPLNSKMR